MSHEERGFVGVEQIRRGNHKSIGIGKESPRGGATCMQKQKKTEKRMEESDVCKGGGGVDSSVWGRVC